MKKEYDFSKAKRRGAVKEVKIVKTFRLDAEVLLWLEEQGEKHGMGYQTFLNWYLLRVVKNQKTIEERLEKLEAAAQKKRD